MKNSATNQVSQKRIDKFNRLVNEMTSEQVDRELQKRQLSIKFL